MRRISWIVNAFHSRDKSCLQNYMRRIATDINLRAIESQYEMEQFPTLLTIVTISFSWIFFSYRNSIFVSGRWPREEYINQQCHLKAAN